MATPVFPRPVSAGVWGWRGVAWDVKKTPNFKTPIQTAADGTEARAIEWDMPIWQFTLSWTFMRDLALAPVLVRNGNRAFPRTEFELLMGFFLKQKGAALPFFWKDPTDKAVIGQFLGVTDGTSTDYRVIRTFGAGPVSIEEPVGGISTVAYDAAEPDPVVYLDGVAQDNAHLNFNVPRDGWLRFDTPPGAGHDLTIDVTYFFKLRFLKDLAEFRTFASDFWDLQKIELLSVRR